MAYLAPFVPEVDEQAHIDYLARLRSRVTEADRLLGQINEDLALMQHTLNQM